MSNFTEWLNTTDGKIASDMKTFLFIDSDLKERLLKAYTAGQNNSFKEINNKLDYIKGRV